MPGKLSATIIFLTIGLAAFSQTTTTTAHQPSNTDYLTLVIAIFTGVLASGLV